MRPLPFQPPPAHPLGSRARILLASVFGPYARDDEYGSRRINPMELYQNQVTRAQGVFSLRMFHRSWGLMLIQANLDAPCTLLDFPSRDRFIDEIRRHPYDIVGISGIVPNIGKVADMCALVRRHRPGATILVGGHVANHPRAAEILDADHVVRSEGVAWVRALLGEPDRRPLRHPLITSGFGTRALGVTLPERRGSTAATVIPSVGCPMGCDFCSTSAMFGGKGSFIDFYRTGDELFDVMQQLERRMGVRSFFVMDENFLLHRQRALRLLELMRAHGRAWTLYVFSSANTLRRYTMDEIVGLGISWVWIGLEGKHSAYAKLAGADTRALVRELQANGIRVLGSTIIGLPEHTPENIDEAIDYGVSHATEFHQFMLYTPVPGTPLYERHRREGTLLDEAECPPADAHGQFRFSFRHPHIPAGLETEILARAFQRDFEVNGPSLVRIVRTTLAGYRRHRHHPEARIRARIRSEARGLSTMYAGLLWAAERWVGRETRLGAAIGETRRVLAAEFGITARLAGPAVGRVLLAAMRREARRLDEGWTYEPPTFYEANAAALALHGGAGPRPAPCRFVVPSVLEAPEPMGGGQPALADA